MLSSMIARFKARMLMKLSPFAFELSRECSEVSLFDWGKSKPQLLPSLLLPLNALSHCLEETLQEQLRKAHGRGSRRRTGSQKCHASKK